MTKRHQLTRASTDSPRRGVVLIIVLVVVVVLALAAYTFSDLMLAHRRVAEVTGRRIQARLLVDSGVEAIKMYLSQDEATRVEMGGHFDNPFYFQGVVVMNEQDARFRGSFTVLAPILDTTGLSQGGVRYGLEDESSRLNMNTILLADQIGEGTARQLLMGLPGMTEDVADAILDWVDEDEDTREYGAEFADYYSTLQPPYAPRNGPLQTVEELLLVRGVTPELLFGADFNRNGVVDPHEQTQSGATGTTTATSTASASTAMSSSSNRGLSAYLTLYSSEKNMSADGLPRIYLNNDDLQALHDELTEIFSDEWATFICAYRLYGASDSENNSGDALSVDLGQLQLDLTQPPTTRIGQVLDLIGAQVQIGTIPSGSGSGGGSNGGGNTGSGGQGGGGSGGGQTGGGGQGGSNSGGNSGGGGQPQTSVVDSPFAEDPLSMAGYLSVLMDNCTVTESEKIPGRISVNEAPLEILLGIPGMTEDIVQQIVDLRGTATEQDDTSRDHETWLLTEGVVTLEEMKSLMPFVCAGGDVYRCQVVGYFQGGGPSSRAEVVFDATGETPGQLFWRDISHLGRGYALETLGVDMTTVQQALTP